ncbi:hypothetical protein, partial [Frankia sp. AiPs1]
HTTNPITLPAQTNLATDLRRLGHTTHAEQLHTTTVTHMGETLGINHPATRNAAAGWIRANCDIDPMPL